MRKKKSDKLTPFQVTNKIESSIKFKQVQLIALNLFETWKSTWEIPQFVKCDRKVGSVQYLCVNSIDGHGYAYLC